MGSNWHLRSADTLASRAENGRWASAAAMAGLRSGFGIQRVVEIQPFGDADILADAQIHLTAQAHGFGSDCFGVISTGSTS